MQLDSAGEQVGRATDTSPSPIQNMRINHRRADVPMSEQFLDGPDVVPILEQMRRERMPQGVAGNQFGDAGMNGGIANGFLKDGFEEVVSINVARGEILVRTVRWEYPLPAPFPGGPGIFSVKR